MARTKTIEPIKTKFDKSDYVLEVTEGAKFGSSHVSDCGPAEGWFVTTL
jgi:hypothetical protein